MARKVFYSFCYEDDVTRSMVVRNRWVTQGSQFYSGVIDAAEFEKVKKNGEQAVYDWIDEQLEGTSVTVVLLGTNTLERKFIQYEIYKSLKRGNGILGVFINDIKDLNGKTSVRCNVHTTIRKGDYIIGYFSDICDEIHNYVTEDGYNNLGKWVDSVAKKKGK